MDGGGYEFVIEAGGGGVEDEVRVDADVLFTTRKSIASDELRLELQGLQGLILRGPLAARITLPWRLDSIGISGPAARIFLVAHPPLGRIEPTSRVLSLQRKWDVLAVRATGSMCTSTSISFRGWVRLG